MARRAFASATNEGASTEVVPAVGALNSLREFRGEDPKVCAAESGALARRIPDSEMRAWMLRSQGMYLIKSREVDAGLGLVRRSVEMDDHFLYADVEPSDARRSRALPMAEAYLAADMPEQAAEVAFGHEIPINAALLVEIAHAMGRPADPELIGEARRLLDAEEPAAAFAYSNWQARQRFARVEEAQERMLRRSR